MPVANLSSGEQQEKPSAQQDRSDERRRDGYAAGGPDYKDKYDDPVLGVRRYIHGGVIFVDIPFASLNLRILQFEKFCLDFVDG